MRTLYSKFVENKVTQYLLTHKVVQKVSRLSALPRKEAGLWTRVLQSRPQTASVFWAR